LLRLWAVWTRPRLIVNPTSGTNEGQDRISDLHARLQSYAPGLEVLVTTGEGGARNAARDAATAGCDLLFVAGGDGTLNEALNGVATVEGGLARVIFGVVPLGTGNDFASALGLSGDPDEAVNQLLESSPRPVDVGVVNGRWFLNVSAGGFIADVSDVVDGGLKTVAGRFAYLLGGAKVLLQARPFHVRSAAVDRDCLFFAVCNAPLIGGGRPIAPHAVIDDGQFDLCVVAAMDLVDFVGLLRRVREGSHLEDPRVEYCRTGALRLEFDRPVRVNADGEVFEAAACDYRILPRAARFLAPSHRRDAELD
jgi:diacylglycerol kinase (ATP)